jgi:hypothetical protein
VVKQSYSSLQTLYKSYIDDHRSAVLHHLRACEQDIVIMSLGKILRKAVTHLTSSEPRRRLDDVLRQCRHPGRGDQYLIDIVDLGSTHLYRSSQILMKIRLGSVMRDIRELKEQIIRYAEWASGLLPSVEKQCSELFTWIKVTSSSRRSCRAPPRERRDSNKSQTYRRGTVPTAGDRSYVGQIVYL